jgi:hypothetical protein
MLPPPMSCPADRPLAAVPEAGDLGGIAWNGGLGGRHGVANLDRTAGLNRCERQPVLKTDRCLLLTGPSPR